jgi:hypothetical protein
MKRILAIIPAVMIWVGCSSQPAQIRSGAVGTQRVPDRPSTVISKDKACEMAKTYVTTHRVLTDEDYTPYSTPKTKRKPTGECAYFDPGESSATICVHMNRDDDIQVLLHRYPEEGWRAQDIIFGSGCGK